MINDTYYDSWLRSWNTEWKKTIMTMTVTGYYKAAEIIISILSSFTIKTALLAQHIEEKSVDVAVTSPPYNNRTKYNSYQDDLPRSQYLQWIESAGISIKKVLADDGSFFLNIGNRPTDQWTALDVSMTLRKHFVLQNRIIWVKSIVISKEDIGTSYPHIINADIAPGHFKPINSPRYLNNCYEDIFHFTKDGNAALDKLADGLCVQYQDKSNIGRYA